jgi:hypothetical protein
MIYVYKARKRIYQNSEDLPGGSRKRNDTMALLAHAIVEQSSIVQCLSSIRGNCSRNCRSAYKLTVPICILLHELLLKLSFR